MPKLRLFQAITKKEPFFYVISTCLIRNNPDSSTMVPQGQNSMPVVAQLRKFAVASAPKVV